METSLRSGEGYGDVLVGSVSHHHGFDIRRQSFFEGLKNPDPFPQLSQAGIAMLAVSIHRDLRSQGQEVSYMPRPDGARANDKNLMGWKGQKNL